jgi:hypothetical protein
MSPSIDLAAVAHTENDNLVPFQIEHHPIVADAEAKGTERGVDEPLGVSE